MLISMDDYHPHADGTTADTACFQRALDAIAARGGGTLYIPPAPYLIGSLLLPENLTLHLAAGATLIASSQPEDYLTEAQSQAECSSRVLLYASGKKNITIEGKGRIDGNASAWFAAEADEMGYRLPLPQRPRMLVLENCRQVTLQDFTIEQAPMWTVHLVNCEQVRISRLCIDNDLSMANTDALDIDSCRYVHVSDSYFSAADDGICIKTTRKPLALRGRAAHITITGTILRSNSCALKIGTETHDDIEDVVVTGCTILDSNRGIGLLSRDGGNFRRLSFSHITFNCIYAPPVHWGKADPVFISVRPRHPEITPGEIAWVQFSHLTGTTQGAINLHCEIPGALHHISFDHLLIDQLASAHPEQGWYDIRPPCNPANPGGMGLDNAYAINPATERPWGVERWPDGMPGLFAQGVTALSLSQVQINRPDPLPPGWASQPVIERP
ncbi:glycoside hydrolase family 28 protein [Mixta sp. Marseille-Q2659]|uniref:glycoside hydrolase family 28 protein n=1 Tax=Mixta sp. Marseille-Q2659 TaxID=2736607 RepID=UPI0023B9B7BF|nr:glycoside hydrolase family 28 protein [Mixta sp. Marseille-Q2659]